MQVLSLVVATLVYIACAYLSYNELWKDKWWYMPVSCTLGCSMAILWYVMMKYLGGDKDAIYFYSLCWDVILVGIYFILPVVCFDVKLERNGLIGVGLMIAGLVFVKLK